MDKLVLKKKGVRTVPTVRGALPKVYGAGSLEDVRIRKIVVNPVGFRAASEFRRAHQIGPLGAIGPYGSATVLTVN